MDETRFTYLNSIDNPLPGKIRSKRLETQQLAGKAKINIFFIIYMTFDYLEYEKIINNKYYCVLLVRLGRVGHSEGSNPT